MKSIGRYFGTGPISALILGGYLFVVVVTACIGGYVLSSIDRLHRITENLFEHPYAVRVSATELKYEILQLRNRMLEMTLSMQPEAIRRTEQDLPAIEARIDERVAVIESQFLGDAAQVAQLKKLLAHWKSIRAEVLELARQGRHVDAEHVVTTRGGDTVRQINEIVDYVAAFAHWRAGGFVAEANEEGTIRGRLILGFETALIALIIATGLLVTRRVHTTLAASDSRLRASMAELQQAKHAAETANSAKSRFLAAASHDLRQPMQAIGLFLDVLSRTGLDERQKLLYDKLVTSTEALNSLLDALLDISKLDAGVVRPEIVATDTMTLLGQLDNELGPLAQSRQLQFRLFFPLRPLIFRTDPNLLLQILRNIVGNAIRYTERGGVLVAVRARKAHLDFEVWDTGVGITAEQLPRIFDEFFQCDNTQRDRIKGLGLGLSIVKRLADLLGYEVACRSRPGRGTMFRVRIPYHPSLDAPAIPVAASQAAVDSNALAGLRVVLIEDDALVSAALARWLEMHQMNVTCFTSGEAALAVASTMEADFYVSDYRLSGTLTGADVLEEIQRRARRPIKGIVITGDTAAEKVGALAATRWRVFHKPIEPGRLAAAIAEMMAASG